MNVHVSYKAGKSTEVEREIRQNVEKLGKRLQVFQPELVHLYATVSETAHNGGASISLNLRLPSGQLAAQQSGDTPIAAVKTAFQELIRQLQRHKELLRNERSWYRKRGGRDISGVPFEQTAAAVKLPEHPAIPDGDGAVSNFLNANLPRLEQFIERELRYRESNGQNESNFVSPVEVLDEVVANALEQIESKPPGLSVERWMYQLAIRAFSRVAEANAGDVPPGSVRLDGAAGQQNVTGSDENVLQFHQPDDSLNQESVIPEHTYGNPEEIAENDEMVAQIEHALAGGSPEVRQAMVLFAVEGFTLEEVAEVTNREAGLVRASLEEGRELLKRKLPSANRLKDRLLVNSNIA